MDIDLTKYMRKSILKSISAIFISLLTVLIAGSINTSEVKAAVTVASTSSGDSNGNTTSTAITMPSGATTGDLVIVFFTIDGTSAPTGISSGSGWTTISGGASAANYFQGYYKVFTGTGDTLTITHANESSAYAAYRITGFDSGEVPEIGTMATGSSANPDPPSNTPSWGSANTLWIAAVSWDYSETISSYPTNYSSNQVTDGYVNPQGGGIAVATYTNTASSENPGTATISGSQAWTAQTFAIAPAPTYDFSGVIKQTDESSAYDCSTGGPYTVRLRVNGSGTYSGDCTLSSGAWSVTGVSVSSGQTVYAYIYNETINGSTVLVSNGTTQSNVDIYQNRVILRDDVNGSITNSEISTGNTADADDLISFSGSDITIGSSYETHITTGDTYAPGANVSTGKLHVVGTYSGSTETLTLTGTGTGTSRPLYINGGSFTAPSTTDFEGDGDVGVEGTTYNALTFTPTITSGRAYTFTAGSTINGNFTANPTAASSLTLTVNLGGTTTVGSSYTTTLTGTTSGESTLDTVSGSNYSFSTGLLNIGALGGLTANNSNITLTGTSGTLFTYATGAGAGFTAGGSTVIFNPNASVTLFSGSPTLYNLSLTPSLSSSGKTYSVGAALTINGDFTINPDATALLLTVNMGGNITVASGKTTTITRTNTATSSLATTGSNYNLSTGLLNIATGGTLTAAGSTSTITLTGTSGTLFTLGGTFTAGSSTVSFTPDADVTLFSAQPTLYNLSLTPTLTAAHAYGAGAALTINNDLTVNPTAGAAYELTFNLGGTTTVAATGTTTIQGSGSATSDLDTTGSNHALSTGFLDVDAGGSLTANNSTITLTGTASTLFTRVGTFNSDTSTVVIANASGTPTLNSGTISFNNLTLASDQTTNTSTDAITVTGTLNVTSSDIFSLASGQNLIHSGTTLTLDGTISGSGTYIYSGNGTLPTTGTLSSGIRLDATNNDIDIVDRTNGYQGAVELYNNSASARNFVLASGTIDITGNLTLNAANTGGITLTGAANDPAVNIGGGLDSTNGGGTEDIITGDGTWTVTGNVDFTDVGTFTATNTFAMDGSGTTVTSAGETFQNFQAAGTISNVDSMDVDGTFTVTAGNQFTHGAGAGIDINISGNFTIADTADWVENTTSTSDVVFDGDLNYADNNSDTKESIGNVIIGASPETTNLTTDFSSYSLTIVAGDYFNTCDYEVDIGDGDLVINGTMDTSSSGSGVSPCSGGTEGGETTINAAGAFTISATGSFVQDASTLIMDNTADTDVITLDGESLYNLTVSASGTAQIGDTAIIENDVSITSGTLDMNGQTITIGGGFDNDANLTHNNASVTFNASSGTKLIDGDGTTDPFYDITFTDGGSGPTYQLTTLLDVDNDLDISSGTLDANGQDIYVQGSWSNSGTFTSNSNEVIMNDTDGGETLSGTMTGASAFYDITFNNNSGAWSFGNNNAAVTHDLTITDGTVTAPGSGYTLTIAEDFNNNDVSGSFVHNSGTVVFNTTATSILSYAADTTFNNLTVATANKTVQFDDTYQTNVAGLFNIQGTDCVNMIYLESETTDDAWDIYVSGTFDIDFADIEDSTAVTTALTANSSTEVDDGNTNWTINAGACGPHQPIIKGDVNIQGDTRIK